MNPGALVFSYIAMIRLGGWGCISLLYILHVFSKCSPRCNLRFVCWLVA